MAKIFSLHYYAGMRNGDSAVLGSFGGVKEAPLLVFDRLISTQSLFVHDPGEQSCCKLW
jgi:hypothetical protein